jgi:2-methylcitrate dehydratase PrpD
MALGPAQQYHLGFHPSAVCGAFGATAAASYLLGLNQEAAGRALGLAACQASGMMAWESDPTENARPFQMGMAARNGVTAALLAARGFGGPQGIFDHGHTVFNAFSRDPRPQRLLAELGRKHDGIMELAIKPYSCVSFLHPGLDALLGLVRDENIAHDAIKKLTLRFPTSGVHCVDGNPLKSHCAQYILPVAVVNRGLAVADIFIDRRIGDANVAALARKVEVVADAELEKLFPDFYATIIEVETTDGRRFERRNDIARGYPEVPLAPSELDAKFAALAGTVATPERVQKLRAAIFALARSPNLDDYAALLRAPVRT